MTVSKASQNLKGLTRSKPFQGQNRGNVKVMIKQDIEIVGGPGGTRTPNQAVMSGRLFCYLFVLIGVYVSLEAFVSGFLPLFQGQSGASL